MEDMGEPVLLIAVVAADVRHVLRLEHRRQERGLILQDSVQVMKKVGG